MIWRIKNSILEQMQHSMVLQGRSLLFRVFVLCTLAASIFITIAHLTDKKQERMHAGMQEKAWRHFRSKK